MRALRVTDDIIPVGVLKSQASKVLRQLRRDGRPVVVTLHGKPAGVLVPVEDFDRMTERERFVAAVEQGLADSEAGRLIDDEELDAELETVLGS
jgi:prevent-host-death family protein